MGLDFRIFLRNKTWLNAFASLLYLDEAGDVRKANKVGCYFLEKKIMKCCGVVRRQSNYLQTIVFPGGVSGNTVKINIDGELKSAHIDLSVEDDDDYSPSSLEDSVDNDPFETIFKNPQPCVGSELFFALDNVNYCFQYSESFASFLLLLLTGELYNMIRQNGQWLEEVIRKDIITSFRHMCHMNRT